MNTAPSLLREHTISSSPCEPFRHVPTLPHHHLMTCHRSWWLFSNHCGFHTGIQGGGMGLFDGATASVSGSSYTSCSAEVSGCSWGPLQPDNVAHVKVWAMYGSHQHTLLCSHLVYSPTHPTPTHVAVCSLCVLLVTVVHLFDPLLHGQSTQHGHHGGGPHLVPP